MTVLTRQDKYNIWFPALLALCCLAYGIAIGVLYNVIVFDEINSVSIASLLLFIVIVYFTCFCDKTLSFFMPFVFLAFPTAVNNFFPGVYLENEEMGVVYPLFCHTEVFLFIALLVKGKISMMTDGLTYLLSLSFLLTSVINMFVNPDAQYYLLLVSGHYPARLLILLALVVRNRKIYYQHLLMGICLAIAFIFLESSVYTLSKSFEVWTSGSLGNNTLGNVMGQMAVMLLYFVMISDVPTAKRKIIIVSAIIGVSVTVLTETRVAMFAMLLVAGLIVYPVMPKRWKITIFLLFFVGIGLVVRNDVVSGLSGKMDFRSAMDAIDYSKSSGLEIRYSEATTSIMTRLKLWDTSWNMFAEKPLTGIGWNLFNVLKYKYGFDVYVIIDPHNGYLTFLCHLGIWAMLWWYFLYYRSWKIFFKSKHSKLKSLAIFNVGMSICELTNSGSYKFGVLSMILLVSVYTGIYYRDEVIKENGIEVQ